MRDDRREGDALVEDVVHDEHAPALEVARRMREPFEGPAPHVAAVAGGVDVVEFHGKLEPRHDPRRRGHAAHHHGDDQRAARAERLRDLPRELRVRLLHGGLAPYEIRLLQHLRISFRVHGSTPQSRGTSGKFSGDAGEIRLHGHRETWPPDSPNPRHPMLSSLKRHPASRASRTVPVRREASPRPVVRPIVRHEPRPAHPVKLRHRDA